MNLRELLRKDVYVLAGGMAYQGKLIEATEENVLLKTDSGFVSVRMDKISTIRSLHQEAEDELASNKFISRSFYEFDDNEE